MKIISIFVIMKYILILSLLGIIGLCWLLVNAFSKPILNKMHNYYEDDTEGRKIANILIAFILFIAFLVGLIL